MPRRSRLLPVAMLAATFTTGAVAQQEGATPEEVVQKVNQAAQYLAQEGEAGLEAFRTKGSEYVWKDSYVVVQDCEEGKSVAHPISPELEGQDIGTLTDETGKAFAQELCEAAQQPQGGWVEYMWPKPGEQEPSRKVSYAKAVAGTPYTVLGGVYDEDATVEELQQISSH
jgi:cytochrome c